MLKSMHSSLVECGFAFDDTKGRYFMRNEPAWDIKVKVEAGRRQGAFPAATVEDFKLQELKWVEETLMKAKSGATKQANLPEPEPVAEQEASEEVQEEEAPKKKKKRSTEEEAVVEVEEEVPKKKKRKNEEEEQPAEDQVDEEKPKKEKRRKAE